MHHSMLVDDDQFVLSFYLAGVLGLLMKMFVDEEVSNSPLRARLKRFTQIIGRWSFRNGSCNNFRSYEH